MNDNQETPTTTAEDSAPQETFTRSEPEDLKLALQQKDEQLLRTLADFDNYRKRMTREAKDVGKAGKRSLLMGILEVLDSFERAFQSDALQAETAVSKGIQSIYRQLKQLLEQHQVLSFNSKGQLFDPLLHEAIHTIEDAEQPNGTIIEECRKGYVWEWNVLRPAQVTVIKNPQAQV
jgi:molecular chaperone GrpE